MSNIDNNAIMSIGYGLYVLTARDGDKDNGCIINVVAQLTDNPMRIMITVNKKNLTHDMILKTGHFNVSLLTEETPMKVIQHFGFQSGKDVNKFEKCDAVKRAANGIYYIPKYTNAYISGRLEYAKDLGTHTLFIAEITEAVKLGDAPSLTYAYYQKNIKPTMAKPAPAEDAKVTRWVCQVCGYVYEGENIPDDFICPWCKHGVADFVKE